ncbi:uncharacterized protein LOC116676024 [Etheostoma spectabile]|uniref:uncharacterized protein LOC116676024 n=1 Tax=Etheostoma spectabile TaxID=54343 RepID=UPI0013AF7FDC|nr:uncharacterized protein LOC116676024 [Etheostoma spectabile]
MMGRVVWILLVLLTIACVTPQDASIQQASPTVGHHKDPCHGGSKDTWGHTADVLWFCYNGSIDATFFVPASALTKQYGGWIGSASTWQGYPWYIEARPSPDYGGSTWGHVVATTEKHWSKNSFGFYKSDVKQMYSNLTYTNGKFSFHLNTTRKDFTPNQGQNCTQHQICAFANGFDPCWQYAFCRIAPKINASTPIQPGVVVPAPVDSQAKEVLIVGKFQPIFHHPLGLDPDANTWYKSLLVILQAGQINESCYACTFFPQSISESMFVRPQPLSEREVQCMMCSLRNITKPRNSNDQLYSNWWRTNATQCDNCTQFDNLPIRANLSTGYKKDEALTRPLMVIPSDQIETTYPRDPDSPDGNYDSTREIHKRPWDDNSDSDDTSVAPQTQSTAIAPPLLLYVDCGCCISEGSSKLQTRFGEWPDLHIRLDIWYFMQRLAVGCTTDAHSLYPTFMSCLSAAYLGGMQETSLCCGGQRLRQEGVPAMTDHVVDAKISKKELSQYCLRRTRGKEATICRNWEGQTGGTSWGWHCWTRCAWSTSGVCSNNTSSASRTCLVCSFIQRRALSRRGVLS